jgi:hypothetical protein
MSETRHDLDISVHKKSMDALLPYIEENRTIGEQNKEKILVCLINAHPEGKSTFELTQDTELDRDTIHEHCRFLSKQGLIIKKGGRRGKYYLTNKISDDPGLRAYWFNHIAMQNFWNMKAHKNNSFCKLNSSDNNREYLDRESLFVFANNIGAYIIHVMIEAVRPNKTTLNLKGADCSKEFFISGSYKDDIARRWIEKAINPQSILHEFEKLQCVKRGLRKYTDVADPLDRSFSFHEMDKGNFKKLTEAFANTFPDMCEKLEDIRKGLKYQIEENNRQFREWKKEISKNKEMQKMYDSSHLIKSGKEVVKCDGIMNVVCVDKQGNKHKKCSKCGKIVVTEY